MKNEFMNKLKKYFDKGVEISQDAVIKANNAVQKLGEQSVIRLDIKALQGKKNKLLAVLGQTVYADFREKNLTQILADDPAVAEEMAAVDKMSLEISKKEAELAKVLAKAAAKAEAKAKKDADEKR